MSFYAKLKALINKTKMTKQNSKLVAGLSPKLKLALAGAGSLALVLGAAFPTLRGQFAGAATCSSIAECQQQISENDKAVDKLADVADTYEKAIAKLQKRIDSIQRQIDISQARQTRLEAKIAANKKKLEQQKSYLADLLKAMYVDGGMTTVEMLATSKDLSDFVDAETYRSAVQTKVQNTMDEIAALQNRLKEQKNQVARLLASQQAQRAQVASSQAQRQQMLAYNESQQAEYNAKSASSRKQLERLIAEQLRANQAPLNGGIYFIRVPGAIQRDPAGGQYEYANAGFGMSPGPGCVDDDGPDRWGYCTRQCVSYAAWAVEYSGREAPVGWGNAKDWVRAAPVSWIHTSPKPGDIAISTAGTWGHAMYVSQVSGNSFYSLEYNGYLNGGPSNQWRAWR